jgi:hypothetical protein
LDPFILLVLYLTATFPECMPMAKYYNLHIGVLAVVQIIIIIANIHNLFKLGDERAM